MTLLMLSFSEHCHSAVHGEVTILYLNESLFAHMHL